MQEDTYRGQGNDPLSLNLYTYFHNNPIIYDDPNGYGVFTTIAVAAGAVLSSISKKHRRSKSHSKSPSKRNSSSTKNSNDVSLQFIDQIVSPVSSAFSNLRETTTNLKNTVRLISSMGVKATNDVIPMSLHWIIFLAE